jgi:DNA replication and repair protein RecF
VGTFFYGKNGAGKSNILEAIYFLAYTKSYKSNDVSKLIQHDAESAEIHASFIDDRQIENTMSVSITGKKKDSLLTRKK